MAVELSVTVKASGLCRRHAFHAQRVDGGESDTGPAHFLTQINVGWANITKRLIAKTTVLFQRRSRAELTPQRQTSSEKVVQRFLFLLNFITVNVT